MLLKVHILKVFVSLLNDFAIITASYKIYKFITDLEVSYNLENEDTKIRLRH